MYRVWKLRITKKYPIYDNFFSLFEVFLKLHWYWKNVLQEHTILNFLQLFFFQAEDYREQYVRKFKWTDNEPLYVSLYRNPCDINNQVELSDILNVKTKPLVNQSSQIQVNSWESILQDAFNGLVLHFDIFIIELGLCWYSNAPINRHIRWSCSSKN